MTLALGDCREVMRSLDECSVDAIVTDPPYGLEFMGKEWDRLTQMQRWHEAWAIEALRVLKPGGHLVAFGAPRTHHRLACAIEDAGFEIRDCLMWLFGSGFPKSKSLLKPAYEPVVLARKPGPLRELGIDACRIEGAPRTTHADGNYRGSQAGKVTYGDLPEGWQGVAPAGRWPANVVLDEEAAAALDEAVGERRSAGIYTRHTSKAWTGPASIPIDGSTSTQYADSGGPSRFMYVAKASRSERGEGNDHPTVKPVALMRWLCRLVTPPGGLVLDPFMGSGSTGVAARLEGFDFVGVELDAHHLEIAERRIDAAQPALARQ